MKKIFAGLVILVCIVCLVGSALAKSSNFEEQYLKSKFDELKYGILMEGSNIPEEYLSADVYYTNDYKVFVVEHTYDNYAYNSILDDKARKTLYGLACEMSISIQSAISSVKEDTISVFITNVGTSDDYEYVFINGNDVTYLFNNSF